MRLRQATLEERQIALLWGVVAVATLVLRPFWLALAPLLPACPFRTVTGVPCPTCGTGRAALAMLHGHPLAALGCNPLAAVAGGLLVAGGVLAPIWALLRGPMPAIRTPLPLSARAGLVLVLLANWVWVIARS